MLTGKNKENRWNYLLIILLGLFLFCPKFAFAGAGLSTSWGEVVIQNLQIGQTYSVQKASNLLFKLTNTGDTDARIRVDIIPPSGEPKKGYEVIPNTAWITLDKYDFVIKSGETAETDVKISIPDDEKYLGKKYQVYLFSYTIESAGFMGVGLKSRLLLHTAPVKSFAPGETLKTPKANLNFNLQPYEIHLKDIKLGKKYSLQKLTGKVFELVNLNDEKYTYQIKSIKVEESLINVPSGYEDCPDPSFLMFKKSRIRVPAKGTKKLKAYVKFPNKEEYKGKKYMFVVYTEIVGQEVPMGVYNRVYVTTKQ